ncbi:ArsR/SmtB family transcription factor [Candidatus Corynebacterium faecigallinarum]|uniref:ArsR/SmtB family transcription factor n=1 Tax=Candidatus Corynebacterium faecigallinarum TaxID=2838528 RepID=UPI003FCF4D24
MDEGEGLAEAAQLFKVLGSEPRLGLLHEVGKEPRTVGGLVATTGLSQPLVSQHLRTLRQAGLVTANRSGKEVIYRLTDLHVSHVIADALAHVQEPTADVVVDTDPTDTESRERP